MENNKAMLIKLFERKINLLLEENEGYARFKGDTPAHWIQKLLAQDSVSREEMVALGFLIHLNALKLRLAMYEAFTPFDIMNFHNDFRDMINFLHLYKRQIKKEQNSLELIEEATRKDLIPPLLHTEPREFSLGNDPSLYNAILHLFEPDQMRIPIEIPEDIIKQMQAIDRKRILSELPAFIKSKKGLTVRKLARDLPIYKNDRLALVTVFSEVLFLANEGKLNTWQIKNDIGVGST